VCWESGLFVVRIGFETRSVPWWTTINWRTTIVVIQPIPVYVILYHIVDIDVDTLSGGTALHVQLVGVDHCYWTVSGDALLPWHAAFVFSAPYTYFLNRIIYMAFIQPKAATCNKRVIYLLPTCVCLLTVCVVANLLSRWIFHVTLVCLRTHADRNLSTHCRELVAAVSRNSDDTVIFPRCQLTIGHCIYDQLQITLVIP